MAGQFQPALRVTPAIPWLRVCRIPIAAVRLLVNHYLEVENRIWALGDCALVPDPRSEGFHPPIAQHAAASGNAPAG